MANGWTSERRARQAALIRTWRPWAHSTGPRTPEGKTRTALNGDRGGVCKIERDKLRDLQREVGELLREQREQLARVLG